MSDERGKSLEGEAAVQAAMASAAQAAPAAVGEKRVALVIGNARYDHGRSLTNPHNDAENIAAMLARLGFELHGSPSKTWHTDLGLRDMRRVLASFSRQADVADMSIVYFAGHGMEFEGRNYLLPRDCEPNPDSRIMQADSITLDEVLGFVQRTRTFRMVILDACRVNEFEHRDFGMLASRGGLKGLNEQTLDQMLVVYAARQGEPALDGHAGDNSPFAKSLIEHLETPDTDVELLIRRVCDSVRLATGGKQVPAKYGHLGGEPIYLKRSLAEPSGSAETLPDLAAGASPEAARLHVASTTWPEVRDSRNPTRLARFEQHFAGTWFAEEARELRLEIEAEARQRAEVETRAKTEEEARQREGANWAWAEQEKTVEAYERFLGAWPQGRHSDEARKRIVALKEAAEAAARAKAEEEARQREASNWAWAEQEKSIEAYERFLGAWPQGRFADEARKRIAALKSRTPSQTQSVSAGEAKRLGELPKGIAASLAKLAGGPAELVKVRERSFEVVVGDGKNDRTVRLAPGETAPKDAPFAPEMVLVPPGKFWMGSKDGEGSDNERPRHEVDIGYPLLVGKYPITFEDWDNYEQEVAAKAKHGLLGSLKHALYVAGGGEKPDYRWGRGRRPVINVNWHDAKAYAKWLSEKTGKTYRLLSEAEWEYACRAGTETAYSFGDTITKSQAQFSEGEWGSAKQTVEVGSFPANPFGLYDMHGNVWEWCADAWHGNYQGAPGDGSARTSADTSVSRVLRGGSWIHGPQNLRSAFRFRNQPDFRNWGVGFRLARTLNPTP